jgi:hypothetical protein
MTDASGPSAAASHPPARGPGAAAEREALRRFLDGRADPIRSPERGEVERHLASLVDAVGWTTAQLEWWALQHAAARRWGAEPTALLGAVLRAARCAPTTPGLNEWERAERAIAGLPEAWRGSFAERLAASREPGRRQGEDAPWSAAYLEAVAHALRRWDGFRAETGCAAEPTGVAFDAYAVQLTAGGCTARTVADYLRRVLVAFDMIAPGAATDGARYVADEWDRRARMQGSTTKTAAGILPASDIYDLGFELMKAGRVRPYWGTRAALEVRNGLLLATAASLPQRARALAALDFATTFRMLDWPLIEVRLPGAVLKMRQARKRRKAFHRILENGALWEAMDEYRRLVRPLLDEGTSVFPSGRNRGGSITEGQIGRLSRNLTEKHLGTSVSVHRVRDCVATEASEHMKNGAWLTPRLLDHRDRAVTEACYDHAKGLEATRALGEHFASRAGPRVDLLA